MLYGKPAFTASHKLASPAAQHIISKSWLGSWEFPPFSEVALQGGVGGFHGSGEARGWWVLVMRRLVLYLARPVPRVLLIHQVCLPDTGIMAINYLTGFVRVFHPTEINHAWPRVRHHKHARSTPEFDQHYWHQIHVNNHCGGLRGFQDFSCLKGKNSVGFYLKERDRFFEHSPVTWAPCNKVHGPWLARNLRQAFSLSMHRGNSAGGENSFFLLC